MRTKVDITATTTKNAASQNVQSDGVCIGKKLPRRAILLSPSIKIGLPQNNPASVARLYDMKFANVRAGAEAARSRAAMTRKRYSVLRDLLVLGGTGS